MELRIRSNNIFLQFSHIFCIFMCIWFLTPYISRNGNINIIFLFAGFWFLFAGNSLLKTKRQTTLLLTILWIGLFMFYRYAGISTCAWGNLYIQLFYWMFFLVYMIYVQEKDEKFLLFLRWVIIVIMIVNIIDNIRLLLEIPNISEIINLSYGQVYLKTNAGQTSFSFICVLLIVGLTFMLRQRYNFIQRIIMWCTIALALGYIFLAGRGTAVLALVIFFVLYLIYAIVHNHFRDSWMAYVFFAVVFFTIIYIIFPQVVANLDEVYSDNRVVTRLKDVVNMLYGVEQYDIISSGESRLELSFTSLKTWFGSAGSFIFGVGDHRSDEVRENLALGIGNHAEFFDVFARYGIVGACLFFKLISKSLKEGVQRIKRRKDWIIFVVVIILYGCINNITKYAGMSIMIYLFCMNIIGIEKKQ